MSPTALTLKALREDGWTCGVVEQTIPHTFIKRDLGGFIDIVAWKAGCGILGIQATSNDNVSARMWKIREIVAAKEWIAAPARLEVWGWAKKGAKGKRKLWEVRKVDYAEVAG